MTMKAPAMQKPVKTRRITQIVSLTTRPVMSAMIAPKDAKAPKARTWPTRRTRRGAK